MSTLDPAAAREHLLTEWRDALETTLDCADAVASDFETTLDGRPATADSRRVRRHLRPALERAGVHGEYPQMLADAVAAAGASLQAPPVAGPPYVAVTSTGPVLRATLGDRRLVVRIEVFVVEEGRFVRTATTPEAALAVVVET